MNGNRPLQGRHALVTGAGRGIGASIVRSLLGQGARESSAARMMFGPIEILINRAGQAISVYFGIQAALPDMLQGGFGANQSPGKVSWLPAEN